MESSLRPAEPIRSRCGMSPRASNRPRSSAARAISRSWPFRRMESGWHRRAKIGPFSCGISPRSAVTAALNGHTGAVNSIAFSSDGKQMISGSDDGTVRLWDTVAAREQGTLKGHAAAVLAAALSPDGKLAASGSADHSVRLWDVVQKRPLATLAGHQAAVAAVAFSPDGRFLASVESLPSEGSTSGDGKHRPIRLWRLPKGEPACEFGVLGASVARSRLLARRQDTGHLRSGGDHLMERRERRTARDAALWRCGSPFPARLRPQRFNASRRRTIRNRLLVRLRIHVSAEPGG